MSCHYKYSSITLQSATKATLCKLSNANQNQKNSIVKSTFTKTKTQTSFCKFGLNYFHCSAIPKSTGCNCAIVHHCASVLPSAPRSLPKVQPTSAFCLEKTGFKVEAHLRIASNNMYTHLRPSQKVMELLISNAMHNVSEKKGDKFTKTDDFSKENLFSYILRIYSTINKI